MFQNWKKEKQRKRNKGTNKQQQPDSGIHDTSTYCPCVPSFNFKGITVFEKIVTKMFSVREMERKKNEEIEE